MPTDLAEWLGTGRLTQLAQDAAASVRTDRSPDAAPGTPLPPRSDLLTLFAYGLARGECASENLLRLATSEPALQALCRGDGLTEQSLRTFRRHYAPVIEAALTQVLGACWDGCEAEAEVRSALAREAHARLLESMRADSLAAEN